MSSPLQQLQALYEKLAPGEQATLLAFAEFLVARDGPELPAISRMPAAVAEPVVVPEPASIERPASESIVAGLKRLSKTYPMLDKSEMLSATSDIVATHIMQGSDAAQAIDELEEIFATHYRLLKDGRRSD